jgi:hypothetical protein
MMHRPMNVKFCIMIHSVANIMVGELMLMVCWWNHVDWGKPKYLQKMLVPGILVSHKSHQEWTGMKTRPPQLEINECDNSRISE